VAARTATEEARHVPEDAPKFIVFRDTANNYRWRLRSAESETLAASVSGYAEKAACEQDVWRLKADRYPDAEILDVSIRGRMPQ
jgi:uncharacterized protein YegP (UPF0339 family)